MDPQYNQMMIQQLMQQGQTNPMMAGQNATSPYGQSFITGGQMMPQQGQSNNGMLNTPVPGAQQLQQAMATYPGMSS